MYKCRSCSSDGLNSIIPLGKLPLANALLSAPLANEPRYNLEVMLCSCCGLAQLNDLIDPAELFSEYVYFSSNSDTMLAAVAELTKRIMPKLNSDALVIEIASNDGYLLQNYVEAGVTVLGIDPAENIAKIANENGVSTLCAFFGETLAGELTVSGQKADIIHANNVMAHVPDINGFIKGIKILLKNRGQAIIEVPYFFNLIENLEFDTIYHEHVYYFSVKPLKLAFERHGLAIIDIEKLSIHGGSLRLFVEHQNIKEPEPIVQSMIKEEEASGLYELSTFKIFMGKIEILKQELLNKLESLKSERKSIAAYGASAKGTTLLNYFGIGGNLIEFVVDKSPAKQGKFTPGTQLEILPPVSLAKVDYALLLVWNFAEEIIEQQASFIEKGGKFILPLPEVKLVP